MLSKDDVTMMVLATKWSTSFTGKKGWAVPDGRVVESLSKAVILWMDYIEAEGL